MLSYLELVKIGTLLEKKKKKKKRLFFWALANNKKSTIYKDRELRINGVIYLFDCFYEGGWKSYW